MVQLNFPPRDRQSTSSRNRLLDNIVFPSTATVRQYLPRRLKYSMTFKCTVYKRSEYEFCFLLKFACRFNTEWYWNLNYWPAKNASLRWKNEREKSNSAWLDLSGTHAKATRNYFFRYDGRMPQHYDYTVLTHFLLIYHQISLVNETASNEFHCCCVVHFTFHFNS